MPQKRKPRLTFRKYYREPRSLAQALAFLATKLPQDNMLEAKNKACQTDFTEPDEKEKTKNPTISDPLHHWSDIYVKEELDVKEEPSSIAALNTICNSPIYIKIRKSCKKQKATQTNEQDVTKKNEVVRMEIIEYAMTYNTRTIESGKRIPKPRKLLMQSWGSFKKRQKVRKKPKAKQTDAQKRLTQIMIESKNPSETTTEKKSGRCGCSLCNSSSFTAFMDNATNRLLKLRTFIKSAPSQKQVAAETNAPINNEQVSEANVPANNEQVAEINAGVNNGQQSVVRDTHSPVLELVSADSHNAVIEANLHEKSGKTNENNKQLATETNVLASNEQPVWHLSDVDNQCQFVAATPVTRKS